MDLDSLITVAAIFVAVYAVIPRIRRLEISLRLGMFGWLFLFASIALIVFLQFYETFRALGVAPEWNLSRWALTPSKLSFLVCLTVFIVLSLYLYLGVKRLSRSNVYHFKEYVFELSREKKYHELFTLIETNVKTLTRIYHSKYPLSRLKKKLDAFASAEVDLQSVLSRFNSRDLEDDSVSSSPTTGNQKLARLLSSVLPSYAESSEAAKEIVHEIIMNKATVASISEMRPYFALRLIKENFEENGEFVDLYLRDLIENKNSILYLELLNNQNLSNRCNYLLPPSNKLIHFLFSDCNIAKQHSVYRPVGEFVISHLDKLYIQSYADPYNEPMGEFSKEGKWDSELFIGVRFFDIMVSKALYQDIKWHMWLYYYSYFANRIIRNLSPNEKLVDHFSEWPTRYHYIIYEMVSNLCNWIESVDHIPLKQENVRLESTSHAIEDGNIPKSSMLALSQIVKDILLSDKFSFKFKLYIMDMVYRVYFYLRVFEASKPYAEALRNCLRNADSKVGRDSSTYSKLLFDTFLKFDAFKYGAELQQEMHRILEDDCLHSKKL
ncbi:hypothetical protein MAQ5080_03297 [Marinomonas aquimarina]|uniref:Uncharacterized protein n=1 Tax=Marinomonas aquimarina TaxID=295068 RepID=A0A1A8TPM4_9GAMM|nr:hypothetical protein [Marinomonas aquimarina]SBS35879.1 hypothetical protein MAQ5080_03297 [Marinomonas aquimarina]